MSDSYQEMGRDGGGTSDASNFEDRPNQVDFVSRLLFHDLSNHLLVIEGNARLLTEEPDAPNTDERAETILQQTEAAFSVIRDAKSLTNGTRGRSREVVDVAALVESEIGHLEAAYPDASITVDASGDVAVEANPLIGSVFRNLLRNALEHNDDEAPNVHVTVSVSGEEVEVIVEDDGPGIPGDVLENISDPDARDDDGLGLFIIHSLVEEHDGSVSIDSDTSGTTVSVSLPLATDPDARES